MYCLRRKKPLDSRVFFLNALIEIDMKPDTHPNYDELTVTCSCGEVFQTRSTMGKELHVEVCSKCHPFYTGKQKMLDTAGQVDKFRRRYGG